MSKGSWYRPVNKDKFGDEYIRVFGDKPLNVMPEEEREELQREKERLAEELDGDPSGDRPDSGPIHGGDGVQPSPQTPPPLQGEGEAQ